MADDLKRTVVWKSLLIKGTDYCALWRTAEGWLLKGTAVGVLKDQRPMLANYAIHCDENWLTHRVEVDRTIGNDTKNLSVSVESRGRWTSLGRELPALRGCDDVDLGVTPATNTHAIRRLDLAIGMSESIIVAWVKFPELEIQPLSQRYTRLAKNTYRYESNTGFSAEIVVDDLGLVITYPGGWERIAML
ncbi:MAG: putative glycolipid-binding domain-containing protein [Terriglobales bacterium]